MEIILYQKIYDKINCLRCTQQQINDIKQRFQYEINSNRRLSYIQDLPQLLEILEKHDCLSPENINPLIEINAVFNSSEINTLIQGYNRKSKETQFTVLPSPNHDLNEHVNDIICNEIGKNWQDFARALQVKEGFIDDLHKAYYRIPDRTREILKFHEENCKYLKNVWKNQLLEALSKARRNDLKDRVQNVFNTN